MQPFRLASGGLIDRSKPLAFHFDGKRYSGFAGDTRRAVSERRARGGAELPTGRGDFRERHEEPNVIVQVGEGALAEPNLKATEVVARGNGGAGGECG
jgi:sarcosine oxidase subunit alpha